MCNGFTRKEFLRNSLIGGVALSTGLGHFPMAYEQNPNLRFSTWHAPLGCEVKTVWEPMLEELKKRSKGKIASTLYAGAALGKAQEHYDIVAKDIATDIGNAMYKRALHQEFQGVKMVGLNGCIQAFLWTKKPVRTLEDVKGLRIRTPGGHQTHYIKALGAEPIFMVIGDVYMAMETGTIDGIVTCPPLVLSFKFYEVAKHGVVANFGCVSEGVIMNEESWKKTPEEFKPVVDDICHNPFHTTGGLTRGVYKKMMKEITDKKVELYNLPPKEAERWYDRFQEVTRKWVADLEAKKLPAKEAVRMYNEECEKRGVKVVAFPPEWR